MRVELRSPERTLALLSGDALLHFRDEADVRLVINAFMGDPGNMASLRHFLADEIGVHSAGELTDTQVIDHLAPLVARSCVGLVRTELLPVRAADAVTGDVEKSLLEAIFDAMVDQEVDLEDIIPTAVLPPTFIQVAEMEAGGITFENKLYKMTMDILRFVGLGGEQPSELAPEFTDSAAKSKGALEFIVESFSGEIEPLGVAGAVLAKATQVGETLVSVSGGQGFNMVKGALKTGAAIMELLANKGDDPLPGEAGPAMKQLAGSGVAKIIQGAVAIAEVLDDGLKGKGQDPAPITVGPALLNGATTQGGKIIDGAVKQGEFLQGVLKGDPAPPKDPSKVAGAFGDTSNTQSGQLVNSAIDTALTLTLLGGMSEADKKVVSEPRWWTKPEFPKGSRLLGIPAKGAWMVARADGSKKLIFEVFVQMENGPDAKLGEVTPELKDGLAKIFWVPEDPTLLADKPLFFEARTEDRRIRVASPSAPIGDPKVVDEATFDKNTVSVDAVGFVLKTEGDPRVSGQEQITPGPVFLVAVTTSPGLVEIELHNALAPAPTDGKAPKPLITFNGMAEGKGGAKTGPGRLVVPWNPGKLPPAIKALRLAARPKRGAGDAAEATVLVVPPFMYGDANIHIDDTAPDVIEPMPDAVLDAGFFALAADGKATPEVPATGAWIIVELPGVQQAKVKIFSRQGEGGRQAVQTLDLKLKDGKGAVQWKAEKPVDRSGMRVGFEVELNGQIIPGEEAPWVPNFLFGDVGFKGMAAVGPSPSPAPAPTPEPDSGPAPVGGVAGGLQAAKALAPALSAALGAAATKYQQGGPSEDAALADVLTAVANMPGPAADHVKALDALDDKVTQAGGGGPKVDAWLARLRSQRSFYASQTESGPKRPEDMPKQAAVSQKRQAAVAHALAQVGRVQAKNALNDPDDSGKPARQGWRSLKMFFFEAWTGWADEEMMKRPKAGTRPAHGTGEPEQVSDILPSWCGVFATWANVAAGNLPKGAWPAMPQKLKGSVTTVPKPGDILNMEKSNHFGLLTWVETPPANATPQQIKALKIRTVEGNTGNNGVIVEREHTLADWNWGWRDPEKWS